MAYSKKRLIAAAMAGIFLRQCVRSQAMQPAERRSHRLH